MSFRERWATATVEVPVVLQRPGGLRRDVESWCYDELKGLWVSIADLMATDLMVIEFEHEDEAVLFKLRWIGAE